MLKGDLADPGGSSNRPPASPAPRMTLPVSYTLGVVRKRGAWMVTNWLLLHFYLCF